MQTAPAEQIASAENQHKTNITDWLENKCPMELYGGPEERLKFLRSMTFDEYEAWVGEINIAGREGRKKIGYWGDDEYSSVGSAGGHYTDYIPPVPMHRRFLMQDAFEAAQATDNLEYSSVLQGLALTATHRFRDGNGEAAREVTSFFARGYDGSSADKTYYSQLAKPNGVGRNMLNMDPNRAGLPTTFSAYMTEQVMNKHGLEGAQQPKSVREFELTPEVYITNKNLSRESKRMMELVFNEKEFGASVLTEFILESGRQLSSYGGTQDMYAKDGVYRTGMVIDGHKLFSELTEQDVATIWGLQSRRKIQFVHAMIDCLGYGNTEIFGEPEHIVEQYRGWERHQNSTSAHVGNLAVSQA